MNDEFDRELEARVRAELHSSIVPPATPFYMRDRVERMAAGAQAPRRRLVRIAALRARLNGVASLAAVVAIVAVVGAGLAWRGTGPGPGAGTPTQHPTLPGTAGPSFPPAPGPGSSKDASLVSWADPLTAVISVKDGGLRMTRDGGLTWTPLTEAPANPTDPDLDFIDATHGWLSSVDSIGADSVVSVYRTADGGRTWQSSRVTSVPAAEFWFVDASVHFADADRGSILVSSLNSVTNVNQGCRLFTTADGGRNWSAAGDGPCLGVARWPTWSSHEAGFMKSALSPTGVVTTTDGGRTWRASELPNVTPGWGVVPQLLIQDLPQDPGHLRLVASAMPTTDASYTARPAVMYASSDGGVTWTEQYSFGTIADGRISIDGLLIYGLSPLGPDHWLGLQEVAVPGIARQSKLVETWDAGRTWEVIPSAGFWTAAAMGWWDARHGILQGVTLDCIDGGRCSGHPTVFLTNDGGRTWHQVPF
jgi:photosystem II stability/assembly factor-like uncharacterized protein